MTTVFIFLIGVAVGSFLNVLIDRLPKGENVLIDRSRCDYCHKTLRWYELIPLVSWIIQGGKCRRCHHVLSIQYPIVELAAGVGFVILFQAWDYPLLTFISYLIIFCSLLVMFVADFKYQIIPDSMVVVGIAGAFLRFISFMRPLGFVGLEPYILSGFAASGFFYLLYLITRGRGMGLGDVKLAFLLGLLLGFPSIVIALYAAFLTGAGVGVILILQRKKTIKAKIAFGPFLIIGFLIAAQWSAQILELWRRLF